MKRRCFGGGHLLLLLQSGVPLHLAHFIFDLHAKIRGDAAEIGHGLAEHARDLRKLLRPKHDQGNQKNNDEMGDAEHASRCEP